MSNVGDKNKKSQVEMHSPESWEYARSYASSFGEIPNSFGSTIRSIITDHEKNNGVLSHGTKFLASRLIKGGNLKAPFYYAILTYKPEYFEDKTTISENDLLGAFKAYDVAALFGIIYLYKKAKKFCDKTEWDFVAPSLMQEIELAGHIGLSMPNIGFANAIITPAMRYLAVFTYLRHNTKHFQEYRRSLKAQKTIFNITQEMIYFGCADPQIASIFLQSLGFGINFSNSYAQVLFNENLLTKTEPNSSPFKVTELWVKTLLATAKVPDIVHDSKFYPMNKIALDELLEKIQHCCQVGPQYNWLDKVKEDLTPETTPKLFSDARKQESSPIADSQLQEVAEDLEEVEQEL